MISVLITEKSSIMLLRRGLIKIVTDIIFDNVNDVFVPKLFHLIYVTHNFVNDLSDLKKFFYEIREFDLISTLLANYPSNSSLCYDAVCILEKIFCYSDLIKISKDSLLMLFKSGTLEIINSLSEMNKKSTLDICCQKVILTIHEKGSF